MTTKHTPNPHVLTIVWCALMASTLVYLFIGWTQISNAVGGEDLALRVDSLQNPLLMPLALVGIVQFVLAIIVPRFLLRAALARVKGPRPKFPEGLQLVFPALILRAALFESIAVYGFVLTMASSDLKAQTAFSAAALLGFVLFFPSRDRLDTMLAS